MTQNKKKASRKEVKDMAWINNPFHVYFGPALYPDIKELRCKLRFIRSIIFKQITLKLDADAELLGGKHHQRRMPPHSRDLIP